MNRNRTGGGFKQSMTDVLIHELALDLRYLRDD
jgi:hypothetical protein